MYAYDKHLLIYSYRSKGFGNSNSSIEIKQEQEMKSNP